MIAQSKQWKASYSYARIIPNELMFKPVLSSRACRLESNCTNLYSIFNGFSSEILIYTAPYNDYELQVILIIGSTDYVFRCLLIEVTKLGGKHEIVFKHINHITSSKKNAMPIEENSEFVLPCENFKILVNHRLIKTLVELKLF